MGIVQASWSLERKGYFTFLTNDESMNYFPSLVLFLGLLLVGPSDVTALFAQSRNGVFVYGDALPDAPKLSARGHHSVGVRTLEVVHENQIDILNSSDGKDSHYDRKLTLEVWYPCQENDEGPSLIEYEEVMGTAGDPNRPIMPFRFLGRASRDAAADKTDGAYPLIIVSHGYVGSRFLMTYLTENLASKGYVVVAIDHTESTFRDAGGFQSTLLNRSKDILFVLDEIADLASSEAHFLKELVDAERTAIIGYSMGGYGALNAAGAAYSDFAIQFFKQMTGGSDALADRGAQSEAFRQSHDPRIKAVVAFAPWGMERGVWDQETLKGLQVPTLFVAGDQDDISGYEKGIKAIYDAAVHADRYLLTYQNARHNVAPNPPPPESLEPGLHIDEYYRYAEPSWDER